MTKILYVLWNIRSRAGAMNCHGGQMPYKMTIEELTHDRAGNTVPRHRVSARQWHATLCVRGGRQDLQDAVWTTV